MKREKLRLMIAAEDNDLCWPMGRSEYPQVTEDGRNRKASHVAWEIYHEKPWPKGLECCHTCDNPPCVNPRHVHPGTHSENIKQSYDRGRHVAKTKAVTSEAGKMDELRVVCWAF